LADVSEPCISSIFKGWVYTQPLKMELIQGSETSANYNLRPGKHPEENIQNICYFCLGTGRRGVWLSLGG